MFDPFHMALSHPSSKAWTHHIYCGEPNKPASVVRYLFHQIKICKCPSWYLNNQAGRNKRLRIRFGKPNCLYRWQPCPPSAASSVSCGSATVVGAHQSAKSENRKAADESFACRRRACCHLQLAKRRRRHALYFQITPTSNVPSSKRFPANVMAILRSLCPNSETHFFTSV